MTHDENQIRTLLKRKRKELMEKTNVVATGIGYKTVNGKKTDDLCIICSVERKIPKGKITKTDYIPATIEGIATDVNPTGLIYAFQDPAGRFRPAPGGVSIGHTDITAGTLGCLVKRDGTVYILSNNHVLANSNDAAIGDPILQPGTADGGSLPDDQIARLSTFIPIEFSSLSPCSTGRGIAAILNAIARLIGSRTRMEPVRIAVEDNLVDAAIAQPINDDDVINEILNIGAISNITEGSLGMSVKKSGRTTGLTTGEIQQIDATVNVSYGIGKIAVFTDQLIAGPMSQGGDSGSAVLDTENNLVGLLFAGSNTSTIMNRIQNVFQLLNLTLV